MARLNLAQRVVGVVALGAVLWLVGAYLTTGVAGFSGWTGYAPLQVAIARPARDGLVPVENLFVWLGLLLAWVAGAVFVLRSRPARRGGSEHPVGPGDDGR